MKSLFIIVISSLFLVYCTTEYYYEQDTRTYLDEDSVVYDGCTVVVDTAWAGHTFIDF